MRTCSLVLSVFLFLFAGLTGNAQDYCRSTYRPDDTTFRIVRGGWFIAPSSHTGSASRYAVRPDSLSPTASIRLVRPI